jgi:hypothetical protein
MACCFALALGKKEKGRKERNLFGLFFFFLFLFNQLGPVHTPGLSGLGLQESSP